MPTCKFKPKLSRDSGPRELGSDVPVCSRLSSLPAWPLPPTHRPAVSEHLLYVRPCPCWASFTDPSQARFFSPLLFSQQLETGGLNGARDPIEHAILPVVTKTSPEVSQQQVAGGTPTNEPFAAAGLSPQGGVQCRVGVTSLSQLL